MKNCEHADVELRRRMRDVEDHATRVLERVENYRALLANLVNVNGTLVAQRQNEEMARMTEAGYEQNEQVKRISSWAAILFAPTRAGIYGMNFDHMPELGWVFGYPFALLLMLLLERNDVPGLSNVAVGCSGPCRCKLPETPAPRCGIL